MQLQLGDVETTALIPVAIKANETMRKNPRVRDEMAVKIVEQLKVNTEDFDKFMSHEGVIARTVMLDRMVKAFLEQHPDAVIVNLGAGFDNRFARVDNGQILWFDLDLPNLIEARKKAFDEQDRVAMIAASILDQDWCAPIQASAQGRPLLFLAEGLFMYLTLEEIGQFLNILKSHFDHGTLIAEQNNPMMVKHQKYHDTVSKTNAVFRSGTWSAEELLPLCEGMRLIEEHSFNEEMKKHSIRGKLFAWILPKFNDRWATFEW